VCILKKYGEINEVETIWLSTGYHIVSTTVPRYFFRVQVKSVNHTVLVRFILWREIRTELRLAMLVVSIEVAGLTKVIFIVVTRGRRH